MRFKKVVKVVRRMLKRLSLIMAELGRGAGYAIRR